jgi:hypothetical protein
MAGWCGAVLDLAHAGYLRLSSAMDRLQAGSSCTNAAAMERQLININISRRFLI